MRAAASRSALPVSFEEAAPAALEDAQTRANVLRATTSIRARRAAVVSEVTDWAELAWPEGDPRLGARAARRAAGRAGGRGDERRWGGALGGRRGQANEIVVRLVSATGAREVVKVKSLTTDEIGLNDALGSRPGSRRSSDLAELIVQLAGERPSHLLVPLYRSRREIAELLREALDRPDLPDDPPALTAAAASTCGPRSCARGSLSPAPTSRSPRRAPSAWSSRRNGRMCPPSRTRSSR